MMPPNGCGIVVRRDILDADERSSIARMLDAEHVVQHVAKRQIPILLVDVGERQIADEPESAAVDNVGKLGARGVDGGGVDSDPLRIGNGQSSQVAGALA